MIRHTLIGLIAIAVTSNAAGAEYRAGVAQIDITPDHPVRLAGFGGRRTESEGITARIYASALALDDGGDPAVLIAADMEGIPTFFAAELAKRLAPAGVRPERLVLAVTHSHTAPMLSRYLPTLFGVPIPDDHRANIDRYTRTLLDKLERVAKSALADRRPAKLAWGVGIVGFAANRRKKDGPTDHDLPLLAVRDPDGKLRAVWVTYACHCVTLSNNKVSGDWAGFAREAIQADHPGAVALVSAGCGADQNPNSGVTGDKVEVATVQGREVARETKRLLGTFLAPVTGALAAKVKAFDLPLADLPPRAAWEEKRQKNGPESKSYAIGHHAGVQLAKLDRGESLPIAVPYTAQTWTFGDELALAFLPGEVVVDYALRLRKELDSRRLWVTAYANDVPCYIPSERVLKEGGYEGGGAMVYYDLPGPFKPGLEATIVGAVKELAGPAFRPPFDAAKAGTPPSPQQAVASIQPRPGFAVELVAAEPLVTSPVAIDFGPDGAMYVAEMYDYPSGGATGRVRRLTSSRGDGRYDAATVFLDGIPFPTGVTVWRKGVLVCAAPDILYAEDTDGDGKADVVKKLFSGFGTHNFQARVNSLEYGLDGWVYGSCGLFGGTITSHTGKTLALGDRDFRIKPDTGEIEPATGRTQQGRPRNDWGDWFGCDNSNIARHYVLADHDLRRNPHVAPPNPAQWIGPAKLFPPSTGLQLFKLSGPPGVPTAACGLGVYRDDLLGRDVTGDLFCCEPVNHVVTRRKLDARDSTFVGRRAPGEEAAEFLASADPWFRPVQARTGPDGGLYVVDMARSVIEHPQWIPEDELAKVDVRAGSTLGRIYRVKPADAPARAVLRLDRLDAAGLVAALDSPNGWQRDMATQMLLWRDAKDATAGLTKAVTDGQRPEARLHALSSLDGLGNLDAATLVFAMADGHAGVRRQAVRIAGERVMREPNLGSAVVAMVGDTDAQVRQQVAVALGNWRDPAAAPALFRLANPGGSHLVAAVASGLTPDNVTQMLDLAPRVPPRPSGGRADAGLDRDRRGVRAARADGRAPADGGRNRGRRRGESATGVCPVVGVRRAGPTRPYPRAVGGGGNGGRGPPSHRTGAGDGRRPAPRRRRRAARRRYGSEPRAGGAGG
ncbi:MAG: PVC-type heme-binding CxxCH protein [Gemmataceae bacterium]